MELRLRALVFLGAFLLFQAELILARLLLPHFGSSAAVWTSCLMCYQGLLFAGYVYADKLAATTRRLWTHRALLLVPVVLLPFRLLVLPGPPLVAVAIAVLAGIGIPFLLLSTSTVLAHRLLAQSERPSARDPYFLYGTSNLGSLLALLTYPAIFEPLLDTRVQCWLWDLAYLGWTILMWLSLPHHASALPHSPGPISSPRRIEKLGCSLFAAAGAALLLAATNAATLDAPVPLMWVLPLTIYLLTLTATFARVPLRQRTLAWVIFSALALCIPLVLLVRLQLHVQLALVGVHSLILLFGALWCHWNVRALRPSLARHIGVYYRYVALGGFLGSVSISVIAPLVFRHVAMPYVDYLLAGAVVAGAVTVRETDRLRASLLRPARAWLAAGAVGCVILAAVLLTRAWVNAQLWSERTFYGFYSVSDRDGLRQFRHGNTIHGLESLTPSRQGEPLAYYYRESPIGRLLSSPRPPAHIAVVGLGVGSLAAYAGPGEPWDFFELDPHIEAGARRFFSFLDGSKGSVRVIPGDARQSLINAADRTYDILVLDAFSSDFVPVHLITREAIALYRRKVKAGGLVVFHISSRLLDLRPVLGRHGLDQGLEPLWAGTSEMDPEEVSSGHWAGIWFALSPHAEWTEKLRALGWLPFSSEGLATRRVWTDEYINLWQALGDG